MGNSLIKITNKRVLFNVIAEYLSEHPTTLESIGPKSGVPRPPEFENDFQPEEIPKVKGFKMNTIVPIHSNLTLKHPMTKHIYDPEPETPAAGKPNVRKSQKESNENKRLNGFSSCIIYNKYLMILYLLFLAVYIYICVCACVCLLVHV